MSGGQRFTIKTYGCQMNVHDTEKVANLLHHSGMLPADDVDDADLLLINTCSIRDKAESKLYSDLGALRTWKADRPGRVIGVGGCVAQQEGDALLKRFPQLDFVFGTHNLRLVPTLAAAAGEGERAARVDETRSLDRFDLPERHPGFSGSTPGRAFVTVMEGCDMFCSFCIVPRTRGREISRPATSIFEEVESLVARGVREVTLLGQTVNAYGRHDLRRGDEDKGTIAFGELLRRLDAIPELERIRYTSPHPLFFDESLVRAHAELESLCPHVHLPLQSGSARILERMRRRYDPKQYREIVASLRAARPDVALTTDLIVGTPGETEDDFQQTLDLVGEVGFVDAFCFKYSPRPGTAAAEATDPVDADVASARLEKLIDLQRSATLRYNRSRVGEQTRIMIEGPSRRGAGQLRGRDPYGKVVNVDVDLRPLAGVEGRIQGYSAGGAVAGVGGRMQGDSAAAPAAGDFLEVEIVEATPHSLVAEIPAAEREQRSLSQELRVL